MPTRSARAVTELLKGAGLLTEEHGELRSTRRWQGAMMRAAARLVRDGITGGDLRLPIALALVEFFQEEPEDIIVTMVSVLTPIELLELEPQRRSAPQRASPPGPTR